MTKVLIIDNYDSFTYNLAHYLEDLNADVTILRNDEIELEEVQPFHKIILSPGPGLPHQAGLLKSIIKEYANSKSILGVCLGHQAIAEVFGSGLINLESVFHGVSSKVIILDKKEFLFADLPDAFDVGRYHSWIVDSNNFSEELLITSVDQNNQIMSFRHKTYDVCGVQFHPESILTPFGKTILKNWLNS
jgi:anthranilate synthase component II